MPSPQLMTAPSPPPLHSHIKTSKPPVTTPAQGQQFGPPAQVVLTLALQPDPTQLVVPSAQLPASTAKWNVTTQPLLSVTV